MLTLLHTARWWLLMLVRDDGGGCGEGVGVMLVRKGMVVVVKDDTDAGG